MPNNKLLCTSKDNKEVYFDPVNSHAATHFADTPQLKSLVVEVLEGRDIANNPLEFDIDMGRTVGTCDVVETDNNDEIIYVIRNHRPEQGYVPFVKTREAMDDTHVSIALLATQSLSKYQLSSAWIGTWDDHRFHNSLMQQQIVKYIGANMRLCGAVKKSSLALKRKYVPGNF